MAMDAMEFSQTGLLSFKSFRRTSTGKVSTADPPLIREIVREIDAAVYAIMMVYVAISILKLTFKSYT